MSYYTPDNAMVIATQERTQAPRPVEQRNQARSATPKQTKPVSSSRAMKVLTNRTASDAERLRAWVRIGLDLGFIEVRDADQIGTARR